MTITKETVRAIGGMSIVTVESDLVDPTFYWYVDGTFVGSGQSPDFALVLPDGDQVRVEILDSTDEAFDPYAQDVIGYSARLAIVFYRPIDSSVHRYVVSYVDLDVVPIEEVPFYNALAESNLAGSAGGWQIAAVTPPLHDLGRFEFAIYSYDLAGNVTAGPAIQRADPFVRTPDAPKWNYTFDEVTSFVTFAEIA